MRLEEKRHEDREGHNGIEYISGQASIRAAAKGCIYTAPTNSMYAPTYLIEPLDDNKQEQRLCSIHSNTDTLRVRYM